MFCTTPTASDPSRRLHPVARQMFEQADVAYSQATGGEHLHINSGLRDVYRQAELYECWRRGENGCNPANIPGASIHNYGLAIDIGHSWEPEVVQAMQGVGFEQTVMPREPWHFEPVGRPEHEQALARQREMKAPGSIARQWQSEWESSREKDDQRHQLEHDFVDGVAQWSERRQQLQADQQAYAGQRADYKQQDSGWNDDWAGYQGGRADLAREWTDLQALQRRIEQLPPGAERDRLVREHQERSQAARLREQELEARKSELDEARARLDALRGQLDGLRARLLERSGQLSRGLAELEQQRVTFHRLEGEVVQH
ncbi:MAG: D-alanyl-D-alanine carboxypeptidase family protein, partial [Candidatus Eremiobacteraeota bacterium]|nr:D-alanyl-D-alanine carboxypeptidase family protein [Candidatus Eremiobacteraeota bacterium]